MYQSTIDKSMSIEVAMTDNQLDSHRLYQFRIAPQHEMRLMIRNARETRFKALLEESKISVPN